MKVSDLPNQPSWEVNDTTTDRDLLERFCTNRDEASFAQLVGRYHGMVLSNCQRILRNMTDAEDAFQATFLVLARRANQLLSRPSIAGWLHQTARRTAFKLVQQRTRLANHERAAGQQRPVTVQPDPIEELQFIVEQELSLLPEKLREPMILLLFEGMGRAETAQRLRLSSAAVKDRLERGRERLRLRLSARGLTLSTALLTTYHLTNSASFASSAGIAKASSAAVAFVSGTTTTGFVSSTALTLAQGVLKMTAFAKMKILSLSSLAIVVIAGITFGNIVNTPGRFEKGLRGKIVSIDRTAATPKIVVLLDEFEVQLALNILPKAKVTLAYQQGGPELLDNGMYVSLRLAEDHQTVNEIHALGKTVTVRKMLLGKGTLQGELEDDDEENADKTKVEYALAPDAILSAGDLPARPEHLNGLSGRLELGKDDRTVNAIEASVDEQRRMDGQIVEVDVAEKKLKIAFERDDNPVEAEFKLSATAIVMMDSKLADFASLKKDCSVRLRLTADTKEIEAIEAKTPTPDEE